MTMADELEAVARALCLLDGVDPDSRIDKPGRAPEPAWCSYREQARRELAKAGAGEIDQAKGLVGGQDEQ
jgi:tRNA-splicing ligase RtcB (3'-phosphate/5'-hydroxy nucleic acid ligase)